MKRFNYFLISAAILLLCSNTLYAQTDNLQQVNKMKLNVKGVPFTMCFIKKGSFTMGRSPETVSMTIPEDFYISETEVTYQLWDAVMGTNSGSNIAQWQITTWFNKAQEFIRRLNNITGKNFRLPTEAEWEYVARSGGKIYGISDELSDVFRDSFKPVKSSERGALNKPNPYGVYGMVSKGGEWCSDYFIEHYYRRNDVRFGGPKESTGYRVKRGIAESYSKEISEVTFRTYGCETGDDAAIRLVLVNNNVNDDVSNDNETTQNFTKDPVALPSGMAGFWKGHDTSLNQLHIDIRKERHRLEAVDNKIGYGYLATADYNGRVRQYYVILQIRQTTKSIFTITYAPKDNLNATKTMTIVFEGSYIRTNARGTQLDKYTLLKY